MRLKVLNEISHLPSPENHFEGLESGKTHIINPMGNVVQTTAMETAFLKVIVGHSPFSVQPLFMKACIDQEFPGISHLDTCNPKTLERFEIGMGKGQNLPWNQYQLYRYRAEFDGKPEGYAWLNPAFQREFTIEDLPDPTYMQMFYSDFVQSKLGGRPGVGPAIFAAGVSRPRLRRGNNYVAPAITPTDFWYLNMLMDAYKYGNGYISTRELIARLHPNLSGNLQAEEGKTATALTRLREKLAPYEILIGDSRLTLGNTLWGTPIKGYQISY